MGERKPFLIRVEPKLLEALERWSEDELRSLNAQIEFLLREALVKAGRLKPDSRAPRSSGASPP